MLDDSRPSVTGQLWSPRPGAALDAGAATHGGAHGPNQDRYLVSPPVYAVADGLGGHEAGEVASALVVEALEDSDDVQNVYTNFDASDEVLASVG